MKLELFLDWHSSPSDDRRRSNNRSKRHDSGWREFEKALNKRRCLVAVETNGVVYWSEQQKAPQVYTFRKDSHGHIVKTRNRDSRRTRKHSSEDWASRRGVHHGRGRGDWLSGYSSSSSSYGSFSSCEPPSRESSSRGSDVILHTEYASSFSNSTLDGDSRDGRRKRSRGGDTRRTGRSIDHGDHRRSRRHPEASGWRSTADIVDWPRKPKASSRVSRRRSPSRDDSSDSRIRYHPDGGTWRDV